MSIIENNTDKTPPRQAVSLTIAADILAEARSLKLNMSQAAESGIAAAVKRAREQEWLQENRAAIAAHNERIEKHGLLIDPYWAEEDGAV